MGRITLSPSKNLGKPWFDYYHDTPQLDPAINGMANSLIAWPSDPFGGSQFHGAVLFNGPNFSGQSLVITQGGSVSDLSQSPWGNLANWIRSMRIVSTAMNSQSEIDRFLKERKSDEKVTYAEAMPEEAPTMASYPLDLIDSDPQLAELQFLLAQSSTGQTQKLVDKITSLMRPFGEFTPSSKVLRRSTPRGGGATISASGQKVSLCQSSACNTLSVTVSGQATVRIEMWYLLAQVAAGAWQIGGPATVSIPLYNNTFNIPTQCGETCYVYAVGVSGNFPVYVNAN